MTSASSDEPLPAHRYQIVDVFNASYGGGNPLGVVLDARGWSDRAMQCFATWTNLVETTFLLPPTVYGAADYKVRIFTPQKEIPFAGHPSVGSAHAFLSTRAAHKGHDASFDASSEMQLVQECGAGLLKIIVDRSSSSPCIYVQSPPCTINTANYSMLFLPDKSWAPHPQTSSKAAASGGSQNLRRKLPCARFSRIAPPLKRSQQRRNR